MKPLAPLLLTLFLAAASQAASLDETFSEAKKAYDAGHYAQAATLYGTLLSNGVSNVEVEYNLGNAFFKSGNLPQAVRHYRRAWYDAPRDPDIAANLHFALNAAGAAEPAPGLAEKLLTSLSRDEWIQAGVAAYLLLMLVLVAAVLVRVGRRLLLQASLVPALLILLAAGGWWQWHQYALRPEWVVVKSDATTLFGPVEGSTPHYQVPLAALVRQTAENSKDWIEIDYNGKKGWLQKNDLQRVSP